MNNLSYRAKFLLMASLFVIPLSLVAGKLANTYHDNANQAVQTKNGLKFLRDASLLIQHLESLRDNSVISFVSAGSVFDEQYEEAKKLTDNQVAYLKSLPTLKRHHGFLTNLSEQIQANKISPGSEAARIEAVYQNANSLVEQAYLWRTKLSYEFLSKSSTFADVVAILDIFNSSTSFFHALGETRAYGAFYLKQQFIDSKGIEVLDGNYISYTHLIDNLDARKSEYEKTLGDEIEKHIIDMNQKLLAAQTLVDEQLLQVITPSANPVEFYQEVSDILSSFYQHSAHLLDRAELVLEMRANEAKQQLLWFYIIAGLTTLLAGYLYIGFFTNVRITIRDLVRSAKNVANGKYAHPIKISSKDELRQLAKAMDEMREKLQSREEELTLISQTDGLSQLKNRKYFNDMIPAMLSSCQRNNVPLCLVMMDIDHFKLINDKNGHQAGDICIQEISKLFKQQFQRKTDIVARYGGEEFIAILYGLTLEQSLQQAEILRDKIAHKSIDIGSQYLTVTASFGVASLDAGIAVSPEVLIELCDTQLYKAKESGRNCVMGAEFNLGEENKYASI